MGAWYFSATARQWTSNAPCGAALAFHQGLPGYAPTPLLEVRELAAELGVGRVLVKDESARLGLPSFKILGASWACSEVLRARPDTALVAATDGNHGRAVAAMARRFAVPATIFVPQFVPERAAALIAAEGAEVVRVDGDYDVAVQRAAHYAAAEPGRQLVQDMAWPGYEDVPAWIVAGYETMVAEVDAQLGRAPDVVVMPVGVGSLAEAVVRHYRRANGPTPGLMGVEPESAACLLASLTAGERVSVATGTTVMAGLNCPTVSSSAWPVLSLGIDAAISVSDADALQAVTDLRRFGISSGPSGAASLAGGRAVLGRDAPRERRESLAVGADSIVVLLSTEGAPD